MHKVSCWQRQVAKFQHIYVKTLGQHCFFDGLFSSYSEKPFTKKNFSVTTPEPGVDNNQNVTLADFCDKIINSNELTLNNTYLTNHYVRHILPSSKFRNSEKRRHNSHTFHRIES